VLGATWIQMPNQPIRIQIMDFVGFGLKNAQICHSSWHIMTIQKKTFHKNPWLKMTLVFHSFLIILSNLLCYLAFQRCSKSLLPLQRPPRDHASVATAPPHIDELGGANGCIFAKSHVLQTLNWKPQEKIASHIDKRLIVWFRAGNVITDICRVYIDYLLFPWSDFRASGHFLGVSTVSRFNLENKTMELF